jgi:hypothetical protein
MVFTLFAPTPASAHPELVLYIDTAASIRNQGQRLFLDYYIAKSQQYSFSEIALFNGDLISYADRECLNAGQNLKLLSGDFNVPLKLRSSVALENVVQYGSGASLEPRYVSTILLSSLGKTLTIQQSKDTENLT